MMQKSSTFFIGAYASAPSLHQGWDIKKEAAYFEGLRSIPEIEGLEIPFYGTLHSYDLDWFLGALKLSWDYMLTTIPGTMNRLKEDSDFGLASEKEAGRKAAIEYFREANKSVQILNESRGRKSVISVLLHSAPRRTKAEEGRGIEAFQRSLQELTSWDWHGAELWVEHCDAFVAFQAPAKGFLRLDQEMKAVEQVQDTRTPVGFLINWGRSAIEGRSVETPIQHLLQAGKWVRGAMLSGCSIDHPLYGNWLDTHSPFSECTGTKDPNLLLSREEAARFLKTAKNFSPVVTGFKFQNLPEINSVEERLRAVREWINIFLELNRSIL